MANSSIPTYSQSVLSYHDELWQMSWGETDSISALKAEMSRAMHQSRSPWNSNGNSQWHEPRCQFQAKPPASTPANYQLAGCKAESKQTDSPDSKGSPVTPIEYDPATFDGELPSVGSEGHFDGSCKRCAFFPKGRCLNGKDCTHCHFAHETRARLRKRARKGGRVEENELSDHEATEAVEPEAAVAEEVCVAEDSITCEPLVKAHEDEHHADSEVPATSAAHSNADYFESILMKLNSVMQEVASAHPCDMTDDTKLPLAKSCGDLADVDTNDSASALSDREEIATTMSSTGSEQLSPSLQHSASETSYSDIDYVLCPFNESKEGSASEASDSESASMQETSPQKPSWSAMRASRKAGVSEMCSAADIARRARALLNKLTDERFESLCSQVLSLPISTTEHLAVVVAEIFEKATTQDFFRYLYTELCVRLDNHLTAQTNAIGGKAFRRALVTECQATFERNLKASDASIFEGLNETECFEVEMKLKTRRLGNMRFIGDLLVRKLLAAKLLPPIVHELLEGDEAALESLMALLTIVGPEFEVKESLYQAPLRAALAVIRQKSKEKTVSSRICFQIQDIMDARARGWAPRTATA